MLRSDNSSDDSTLTIALIVMDIAANFRLNMNIHPDGGEQVKKMSPVRETFLFEN
jgi:hypothetical protein